MVATKERDGEHGCRRAWKERNIGPEHISSSSQQFRVSMHPRFHHLTGSPITLGRLVSGFHYERLSVVNVTTQCDARICNGVDSAMLYQPVVVFI